MRLELGVTARRIEDMQAPGVLKQDDASAVGCLRLAQDRPSGRTRRLALRHAHGPPDRAPQIWSPSLLTSPDPEREAAQRARPGSCWACSSSCACRDPGSSSRAGRGVARRGWPPARDKRDPRMRPARARPASGRPGPGAPRAGRLLRADRPIHRLWVAGPPRPAAARRGAPARGRAGQAGGVQEPGATA
jgi:hypothetical protein